MNEPEDPNNFEGQDVTTIGLFVKASAGLYIKILLNDIAYLKADKDYTKIITLHGEHLKTIQIGKLLEKLDHKVFCRVHQSYAINTSKIDGIHGGCVVVSGIEIPIGRTYKIAFFKHIGKM